MNGHNYSCFRVNLCMPDYLIKWKSTILQNVLSCSLSAQSCFERLDAGL